MNSLKQQADEAISQIQGIERQSSNYTFNITKDILGKLQDLARTQINTDLTVLREDAYSHFATGMESVKNLAAMTPSSGLSFISEQGEKLSDEIKKQYGDLGGEFNSKVRGVILHQQLKYLADTRAGQAHVTFNQANDTLRNLADNANSIPRESLSKSIDSIHDAVNAEFGNDAGELLAHNAYEIAKLRGNAISGNTEVSTMQPPIIPNTTKNVEMNTKMGTDLRRLMVDNPMLARGFLRIHDVNSADATKMVKEIQEKYPDSPEPAAIETANRLRTQAIQANPLEYGANQLYYGLTSSASDVFTGNTDHRYDAARRAYELFGVTNFFTEEEKQIIKAAPLDQRVGAYVQGEDKLNAYNSKLPSNKRIDPTFFTSEFHRLDPDAVAWGKIVKIFPQFHNVAVTQANDLAKNLKATGQMPKTSVPDQLLRVEGIGTLGEKITAAHYMLSGDIEGVKSFFNTRDNYAYPKTYQYGSRFQDLAMELLHKNIRLVNTGIDTYAVYKLNGEPLVVNGSTVQYLAKDLEAMAESRWK